MTELRANNGALIVRESSTLWVCSSDWGRSDSVRVMRDGDGYQVMLMNDGSCIEKRYIEDADWVSVEAAISDGIARYRRHVPQMQFPDDRIPQPEPKPGWFARIFGMV